MAGSEAVHLWLGLRAYCARYLTDGHIPTDMLDEVRGPKGRKRSEALAALAHVGLLEKVEGGVVMHDYLQWSDSRDSVLRKRAAARDRQAKSRGLSQRDSARSDSEVPAQSQSPILTSPNLTRSDPPVGPPEGDETLRADIRRVFEAWQRIHGHQGAKLDRARVARIKARLADKFTADQLIEAIGNAKNDRFLMGENVHGRVYDGIETLLKSVSQVERLIALRDTPSPRQPIPSNPRTAAADQQIDRQQQRDIATERARLERTNRLFAAEET